ncbi:MAG TPA: glycoside hydrolase family 2 TIM barrel-domain containing protein [Actinomycetales bacterium]|nr:glycoside hydrolase family 2 TIM barrel-domain containing protein [Actinomycetales bacterium]
MDPAPVRDAHPRPQLARSRWIDLNGQWRFGYDDQDVGVDEGWAERPEALGRTIEVPFPPESPASGVGDTGYHPVVWYARTFTAPQEPGERLLLHFGAVDYRAAVWVNGRQVATHEGGHTPFSADITPALRPDGEQLVVVRAEDDATDMTQPRGKQDWRPRPHSVWYERTTGIWQPVWLEPVSATRIGSLGWTPDLARAEVALRVGIEGKAFPLRVRVRLALGDEPLVDATFAVSSPRATLRLPLDRARIAHDRRAFLWAPDHPNLLDATVTVLSGDDVVDEVSSYLGLRSVALTGGRLRLNDHATVLRMVLAQNYWPQSHLAAPSGDALRREVELVKELGFNGVRIHQKVEDPRFLYWCDVLGVMAWAEMPSALDYQTDTVVRLTREWLEVLERDVSAPSIIAWVPFNESWGVPNLAADPAQQAAVRALYSLTKAIDQSRPVVANDGWEHEVSDILGVHDYSQDAEVLQERYGSREAVERTLRETEPYYRSLLLRQLELADVPLMITEFGGVTYDPESDAFWNGYGAVDDAEELAGRYEALVAALLDSPMVAGFCYTQLTDTAQERNGLLFADRRPKVDPARIAEINRRVSAAVPADAIAEVQIVHAARRSQQAVEEANF